MNFQSLTLTTCPNFADLYAASVTAMTFKASSGGLSFSALPRTTSMKWRLGLEDGGISDCSTSFHSAPQGLSGRRFPYDDFPIFIPQDAFFAHESVVLKETDGAPNGDDGSDFSVGELDANYVVDFNGSAIVGDGCGYLDWF
jgi:hypothetical protein